jgi:biopolymer transport protein ExbD
MAMTLRPGDDDDEEPFLASINTTPLVDVMLVLLIIFLITIPVVTHSVPVALPHERDQPTTTRPRTIIIAVDRDGGLFWNDTRLADTDTLLEKLKQHGAEQPPPEVQIRADKDVRYASVGRVVTTCQRAGITRIAFITEPGHAGASPEAE